MRLKLLVIAYLSFLSLPLLGAEEQNMLSNVEVFSGDFSTQAMFFFAKPFSFKKKVVSESSRLTLFFPSSKIGGFNKDDFLSGITNKGIVEKVALHEVSSPVQGIIFDIKFVPSSALVKIIHMGDKNKLIVEFYSKQELEELDSRVDGPLHLALNRSVESDYSSFLNNFKKKRVSLNCA